MPSVSLPFVSRFYWIVQLDIKLLKILKELKSTSSVGVYMPGWCFCLCVCQMCLYVVLFFILCVFQKYLFYTLYKWLKMMFFLCLCIMCCTICWFYIWDLFFYPILNYSSPLSDIFGFSFPISLIDPSRFSQFINVMNIINQKTSQLHFSPLLSYPIFVYYANLRWINISIYLLFVLYNWNTWLVLILEGFFWGKFRYYLLFLYCFVDCLWCLELFKHVFNLYYGIY